MKSLAIVILLPLEELVGGKLHTLLLEKFIPLLRTSITLSDDFIPHNLPEAFVALITKALLRLLEELIETLSVLLSGCMICIRSIVIFIVIFIVEFLDSLSSFLRGTLIKSLISSLWLISGFLKSPETLLSLELFMLWVVSVKYLITVFMEDSFIILLEIFIPFTSLLLDAFDSLRYKLVEVLDLQYPSDYTFKLSDEACLELSRLGLHERGVHVPPYPPHRVHYGQNDILSTYFYKK